MTQIFLMRRQVVDLISNESGPMIRLSTMNAHIAREQEFHNPANNDVKLLGNTCFSRTNGCQVLHPLGSIL